MKKLLLVSVAAIFATAAFAATNPATATFDVKLTVLKACSVTAGATSDISFGSQDASATNLEQSNTITVICSKKTPYTIGLKPSNNATDGAGVMAAQNTAPVTGNTDTVAYQLRSTTGTAGTVWGDAVASRVGATGNGTAQSHTVFATVPSANVTPDDYKDTVTVSVYY